MRTGQHASNKLLCNYGFRHVSEVTSVGSILGMFKVFRQRLVAHWQQEWITELQEQLKIASFKIDWHRGNYLMIGTVGRLNISKEESLGE
jgi:hypothetical protein